MPEYVNSNGLMIPKSSIPVQTESPRTTGKAGLLRPLVNQWLRKSALAEESKRPFQEIANQCHSFFSKSSGFMWQDEYRKAYMGSGIQKPKFQITLQKAFEMVAIFGPYLFWKYPNIYIKSEKPIEFSPEMFGDPQDPMIQQMFEQIQQEKQLETQRGNIRNSMMEKYLNYSQREQPGGGLAVHGEVAVTEALVKGRSCLWPESYKFAGSNRQLTGRFWDTVDNLLIDPDSTSPVLEDAEFIIRKHRTKSWKLERMFELDKDSLKHMGVMESAGSQAVNQGATAQMYRRNGMTNDVIEWYEIWSKAGVGSRMDNYGNPGDFSMNDDLHDAFDENVGDYAYLCISPQVPWPLNCPSKLLERLDDEQIKERFQWRCANYGAPFPCYLDGRWPVALLDFYRNPDSCWPIAPLAPALGELTCMNILISAFVEQGYENRKTIIAHLGTASEQLRTALTSNQSPAIVVLNDAAGQKIDEMISYIKRPEMNTDLLQAISFLSESFDKRVGLPENMYGMNVGGTQSRTAKDVQAKEEKTSIRPEKMAGDVAKWMTEAADLEKFLAGWTVEGKDLIPLLTKYGAMFWDQLIVAEDPEVFVREMRATVEAGDIRKPNKERLQQNLQNMQQYFLPLLQQYAEVTGDTTQLNSFIAALGESMEQDVGKWQFGPWQQQPDEQQQQAEQMQAQLEQSKLQAEILVKQIDAQKAAAELEKTQLETQLEAQTGGADVVKRQLEMIFDQREAQQEIEQSEDSHDQDQRQDQEKFSQEQTFDRAKHIQDILQKREESRVKLEGMQMQNLVKAQAARNPKSNGSAV
jgi:hypothetical protein